MRHKQPRATSTTATTKYMAKHRFKVLGKKDDVTAAAGGKAALPLMGSSLEQKCTSNQRHCDQHLFNYHMIMCGRADLLIRQSFREAELIHLSLQCIKRLVQAAALAGPKQEEVAVVIAVPAVRLWGGEGSSHSHSNHSKCPQHDPPSLVVHRSTSI